MRIDNSSKLEKALEFLAANSFLLNLVSLGLLKKWQSNRESEQLLRAQKEAKTNAVSYKNKQVGGAMWWNNLPWVITSKKVEEQDLNDVDKLAILTAAIQPEIEYSDDPNLLQNRPWYERAIVLSGGVVFNLLLAFVCFLGEFAGGKGLPRPVFDVGAVVSQMPSKESPSFGVLNQGDVILGINDMVRSSSSSNYRLGIWASQKEMSDIISVIRETPIGEKVKLTVIHGRGSDTKDEISIYPKKNSDGLTSIGVTLMPNYVRTEFVFASSLVDAISKAGSAVYELTSETAQSILGLLFGVLLGKGLPAGTSMSGPLGVIKTGTEVVRGSDFAAIVSFAASISINLAVVNSLPLPALDGGQLVFVLAEAAAGRRIDQRVQEGINAGALLILLFISFGAAVGDVASILN